MKVIWYRSLRFTILFWFLLLSLIPLAIISYESNESSVKNLKKSSFHDLQQASILGRKFVNNWFYYRKVDISNWSQTRANREFLTKLSKDFHNNSKSLKEFITSSKYLETTAAMEADMLTLVRQYDYVYNLFLIDKSGNILYSVSKEDDLGTNLVSGKYSSTKFASAFAKTLKDGEVYFSDLELYEPSNNMVAGFLTAPLVDKDGESIGVFAVQIKLDRIFNLFEEKIDKSKSYTHYLVGVDSLLRSKITLDEEVLKFKVSSEQYKLWYKEHGPSGIEPTDQEEIIFSYLDPLENEVFGLHQDINILGIKWVLISEVSKDSIHAITNKAALRTFMFFLITMIIVIVVSLLISRRIVKPLRVLSDTSIEFSKGKRDIRIEVDVDGEIGLLASAFNTMIESLQQDEKKLKEQAVELRKANEAAQESVKAKAEFLASMSHEIRTPMNGVIGMLGLLIKSKLDDTQKHQAFLAQSSAEALLTLINDILDFSKVEAGKMDLEYIDFNLRDELGNFAEAIAFRAQEKGVELILDVTNVERKIISGDAGRIRQILSNIVGNSIKFTSKGYILIKASLNVVDDEKARLIIEMSDTGIGIPEDKIDSLFDSFSQVDASTTRKYGGTGLGLAIVKKLCELMDGRVDVKSREGKGSTFTVDIAVKLSKKSSLVKPNISVDGKKVLIVDNSELNIDVLQNQLEHWSMEVNSVNSAKEALKKLENNSYDITFIDKEISDMNIEELGRKIRENSKCNNMKLVMMTSLGDRGDIPLYTTIGFDVFFPKPTTTKDLLLALDTLTKSNEILTNQTLENEKESVFDENINILLVEDNLTNQLVANGILEDFGLEADVANHGMEAIDILNNSSKRYDIILMDCQMPELDGYDTTRAIRDAKAGEAYIKIPIVAMTANAMQGDKEKCEASGMDDYLAKPIDPERLKNMLQKWLVKVYKEG